MWAQRAAILGLLALVGCGEPAVVDESADGSTTPPYVRAESDPSLLANMVQPIRIGELGPSFAACNGRGAIRDRSGAGAVPVRAAPYEQSGQIAALAPGSQFFICSRTNDQRWFGIVYDEGGLASERCAVSAPVPSRRSYQGPCAAGWVASASVRLVSGVPHQLPAGATQPVARQPIDSRDELKRFRSSSQSRRHPPPIRGRAVAFLTLINHLAVTR